MQLRLPHEYNRVEIRPLCREVTALGLFSNLVFTEPFRAEVGEIVRNCYTAPLRSEGLLSLVF